jgi:bifunctional non-homologous end joining protein LigD
VRSAHGRRVTHLHPDERLPPLGGDTTPFDPPPPGTLAKRAHWVEPRLVAEVQFTEWTGDGKIRHPSLQGFRADRRPADVRREREADATN